MTIKNHQKMHDALREIIAVAKSLRGLSNAMARSGLASGADEVGFAADEIIALAQTAREAYSDDINEKFEASQRSIGETFRAFADAASKEPT